MSNKIFYTYVLVRTDIPIVQQTVQACHAALSAGQKLFQPKQADDEGNLIILQVANELELRNAYDYLERHKVKSEMFYEPDYGPLGLTALGTEALPPWRTHIMKPWKLWQPHYSLMDRAEAVMQSGRMGLLAIAERMGCHPKDL